MNQTINIHSDHFIIDEFLREQPEDSVDKRFLDIPQKFKRHIDKPILFCDFDSSLTPALPEITEVYELLVSPSKLDIIDIKQLAHSHPRRDIVSMIGYFWRNKSNTPIQVVLGLTTNHLI